MEQQPFDWPADCWMQHAGRDFRGRLEHKPPERHPRMWQREHGRFGYFVAVEQDVDIDCAAGPTFGRLAAETQFDFAKLIQQRERWDDALDNGCGVQKLTLIRRPADGVRPVPLAVLHNLYIGQGCDFRESSMQRRLAVTKIRTETEQTSRH
jgi:hypothetical protein